MKSLTDKVDELFTEWDKPDSPGCAIGIIQDGKLIYTRGYGMSDLENGIPLTAKSVFYIASTSKQFTAASIVLLAQRGHLSLDDDLREYVPEVPQYERPITIRHLIHHTSGIRDYLDLFSLAGRSQEESFGNEDAIEILSRQKAANFSPGERHLYSNSGYILLAEIVGRVSGKSLREFAEGAIFKPLRMHDTFFDDDLTPCKGRVISYRPGEDGGFQSYAKNLRVVGDCGLLTTVEDLYRWDQGLYGGKLFDGEFISQMLTCGKLNSGEQLKYAFGLVVGEYRGLKTIHHPGSMLGFQAQMIHFPEQNFTVICLCNLSGMNPPMSTTRIAHMYLLDDFELTEFEGEYYSDELRSTCSLVIEGRGIFLRHQNAPENPLRSVERDTFRVGDRQFVFGRNGQGEVTGFTLSTERGKGIRFVKNGCG